MSAGLCFGVLEEKIAAGDLGLRKVWEGLKPVIDTRTVASRDEAYIAFSRVFKLSQGLLKDSEVSHIWQQFLEEGYLCIEGEERRYYFNTLLARFKEGAEGVKISWITYNSEENNLEEIAKEINAIAQEALGGSGPGIEFLHKILPAPCVVSMVAKCDGVPIAGFYATFVEELSLLYINLIVRKIDWPNINIIQQLQNELSHLQERFLGVKCVALSTPVTNTHAQQIYRSLDFEQIERVENAFDGKPVFFYGKKLDSDAVLPGYAEFKKAYDAARSPYLNPPQKI